MGTIEMRDQEWGARAARRRQRAIDAESSVVGSSLVADGPGRLARWGLGFFVAILMALPIMFGGVHATVYGPVEVGIFVLTALLVWPGSTSTTGSWLAGKVSKAFGWAVVMFCTYLVVRGLADIFFLSAADHPVLGSEIQDAAARGIGAWLREVFVFLATIVAARSILAMHPRAFERLTTAIIVAGVLTAMIGLAHWFYDNGRLFWFFEPENVFISQRARWPFVNANHLACFLLPTLFLILGRGFAESAGLRSAALSQRTGRMKSLADLASDERFQRKVVRLAVTGVLGVAVILCIIATLSRGAWLGTVLGLITFVVLDRFSRPSDSDQPMRPIGVPHVETDPNHRSSRRRRRSGRSSSSPFALSAAVLRRIRIIAVALLCLAVYLFLRDRGVELVESRIEYGLLQSKEDMRFQLLTDTWPLITVHPWFGLGLGGWATAYAAVMSPLLAGINPVYLHNEPAQLLAEAGMVGLLLAAWCVVVLLVGATRALKSSPERLTHVALVTAVVSTLAITLFDFHLRIPAISFQLAIVTALIIDLSDRTAKNRGQNESEEPQVPS